MRRDHLGLRRVTAALGAVLVVLSTGFAAQAQETTTTTYPPRPYPQTTGAPTPISPSDVVLSQPKDMYLHVGAPTEWWWFTGTLLSGSRTFGFEINAASFIGQGFAFSQLSLTDVKNQQHYERTTPYRPGKAFNGSTWAQSNPKKGWFARLGSPRAHNSWVSAQAPASDPTKNIHVKALLIDDPTMKQVNYDLTFSQVGRPFYVWGTGVDPLATHPSLMDNNYYFSLTHLQATGTITVGGKKYPVHGVTWMDHEYGAFGSADHPVQWILQDLQLSNGWSISNVGVVANGATPQLNVPFAGYATLESPDGKMYFVASSVTPIGGTWTSPQSGKTYFTSLQVNIPTFNAQIVATTLVQSQEFPGPTSVYEGVATARGTFRGSAATAQAWIEETF